MEAQRKLIIGGTGYGKSMISVWMDQQQYEEFQKFCEQNDLEYHLLSHKRQERCLIACETSVMNQFRFKAIQAVLETNSSIIFDEKNEY